MLAPQKNAPSSGFTLIELLVVITIIVLLLALLMPALDKAIYQAELAVCGADLKAMSTGVSVYATDHKRNYPYRRRAVQGTNIIQHELRSDPLQTATDDLRPRLVNYLSVNGAMQCPLTQDVQLEVNHRDTNIFASYQLWFGWQFKQADKVYPGMLKMGDRLGFHDDRFDVLASDVFANNPEAIQASHPDREGLTNNTPFQDQVLTGIDVGGVATAGFRYTFSLWLGMSGAIDRQFAYADGSVERFDEVRFEEDDRERMVFVPWRANSAQFNDAVRRGTYLPKH